MSCMLCRRSSLQKYAGPQERQIWALRWLRGCHVAALDHSHTLVHSEFRTAACKHPASASYTETFIPRGPLASSQHISRMAAAGAVCLPAHANSKPLANSALQAGPCILGIGGAPSPVHRIQRHMSESGNPVTSLSTVYMAVACGAPASFVCLTSGR
jgi:hypothetical protein